MELLMKAAAVGVAAAVMALLIKKGGGELSLLLAIAAAAFTALLAVRLASEIGQLASEAAALSGMSDAVLTPVLKCVGIAVMTKLSGELCRDAGQGGIASSLELLGAVSAVYAALPLLRTLLKMVSGLVE